MKVGDLVRTSMGNVAIVMGRCVVNREIFLDVWFLKTQYLKTGFPACQCEILNESR